MDSQVKHLLQSQSYFLKKDKFKNVSKLQLLTFGESKTKEPLLGGASVFSRTNHCWNLVLARVLNCITQCRTILTLHKNLCHTNGISLEGGNLL